MQFVNIKWKVPPEYKLLILKQNSYSNVNKNLSATGWASLYEKSNKNKWSWKIYRNWGESGQFGGFQARQAIPGEKYSNLAAQIGKIQLNFC